MCISVACRAYGTFHARTIACVSPLLQLRAAASASTAFTSTQLASTHCVPTAVQQQPSSAQGQSDLERGLGGGGAGGGGGGGGTHFRATEGTKAKQLTSIG